MKIFYVTYFLLHNNRKSLQGFKTSWNNNFDMSNDNYRNINQNKVLQDDLKILRRASILVSDL